MDDLLKYFQNLYYGFRFKRLKVDDAMHIPEMAEDAGNIRLNEKLQVKLDGIWTEVSGEKIIIDELPTDGSEHAVSSGGVYMKIAAERDERISSIADEAMQRNLAFFVAQVYVKRDLRDSVPDEGDTLRKLYNIIISSFSEITVADIAARNASIVKNGDHVFVTDDGDGRWALYKATSAGVNATYIKLSDPDMLNAIMSASQIKASYESNPDTNAFTNALLNKLNAILGTNTGDQDISGIALNASAIIAEVTNRQNIISALQADILTINNNEVTARAAADAAEANARGNADTTLQNNINANSTNISANATAISNEVSARSTAVSDEATSRAGADTTLQNNINANSTNISANATAISNEVTNRTNAVSAEATARANADANKVDAVTGYSLISNTELTRLSNILGGIPSGGSSGQFLKKTAAGNFAVNFANLSVTDISDLGSTYISLSTILIAIHTTSIGNTQNSSTGLTLINDTPALLNAQQYSPAIRWIGQGWKATAPATSQTVEFRAYVTIINGTNTAGGSFVIESSIASANYSQLFSISQGGICTVTSTLNVLGGGITSTGMTNITTQEGLINAPIDGLILNSVPSQTSLGRTTMFAPSLRWNSSALNASNIAQAATFRADVRPTAGTTPIIASWFLSAQINNTGYTDVLQVTHTGTLITKASTAAAAGFRLLTGAAPTAPVNGDMWQDGSSLKIQLNGATKTFSLT